MKLKITYINPKVDECGEIIGDSENGGASGKSNNSSGDRRTNIATVEEADEAFIEGMADEYDELDYYGVQRCR